jgi:ABC-type transporter MlaC component
VKSGEVGSWAATPELKQHQVAEAFGRYITATWTDRFDSYSGEKLEVTGEQPYAAGNLVHTRIVKIEWRAGRHRLSDATKQ